MSMRFIDENLMRAFEDAKMVFVTNEKLGEHLGISQKHVGQILAGRVQFLKPKTWAALEPKLHPYIKDVPEMIPAPVDNRRRFVAENLNKLSDEQVEKIVLEIVSTGDL